jgi:hypothetical protein
LSQPTFAEFVENGDFAAQFDVIIFSRQLEGYLQVTKSM